MAHERYRRETDGETTDDRQTDGRRHIANVLTRSLKTTTFLSTLENVVLLSRKRIYKCLFFERSGRPKSTPAE